MLAFATAFHSLVSSPRAGGEIHLPESVLWGRAWQQAPEDKGADRSRPPQGPGTRLPLHEENASQGVMTSSPGEVVVSGGRPASLSRHSPNPQPQKEAPSPGTRYVHLGFRRGIGCTSAVMVLGESSCCFEPQSSSHCFLNFSSSSIILK